MIHPSTRRSSWACHLGTDPEPVYSSLIRGPSTRRSSGAPPLRAHPEPVEGWSFAQDVPASFDVAQDNSACSWFDKLTTSAPV